MINDAPGSNPRRVLQAMLALDVARKLMHHNEIEPVRAAELLAELTAGGMLDNIVDDLVAEEIADLTRKGEPVPDTLLALAQPAGHA